MNVNMWQIAYSLETMALSANKNQNVANENICLNVTKKNNQYTYTKSIL